MPVGQSPTGIFMNNSMFHPNHPEKDTSAKIVAGLERISEAFKVLLWDKAKQLGLSPIQIQILIFVAYHKDALCNVSQLAKEFNVTKPTISDAIKALDAKGLILKDYSSSDSRSYTIVLSTTGKAVVANTEHFAQPLQQAIQQVPEGDLETVFELMSKLIYSLNRAGILTVQRTCFGCTFYAPTETTHYCNLLQKELLKTEIRLDCPEFVAAEVGSEQ